PLWTSRADRAKHDHTTGGSILARSAHFGGSEPATPGRFSFGGAAAAVSTTTRRPSAKPTRLCRCHLAPSAALQRCALARRRAPLRFALPPRAPPTGSQSSRSLHNLSSKPADESRAPPRSP